MAKYEMREVVDLNGKGERVLKPYLEYQGVLTLEDIAQHIQDRTTHTRADVMGVLDALAEEVAKGVARGYSVKLKGLGMFSGVLDFREGVLPEKVGEEVRRNAKSVVLKGVRCLADKALVRRAGTYFTPERSSVRRLIGGSPYTEEERYERLVDYLQSHAHINIADYMGLVSLTRTRAGNELRLWAADPGRVVTTLGRGTHKVYVLRKP